MQNDWHRVSTQYVVVMVSITITILIIISLPWVLWGLQNRDERYEDYLQTLYSLKRDDIDVHIRSGAYVEFAHTQEELSTMVD